MKKKSWIQKKNHNVAHCLKTDHWNERKAEFRNSIPLFGRKVGRNDRKRPGPCCWWNSRITPDLYPWLYKGNKLLFYFKITSTLGCSDLNVNSYITGCTFAWNKKSKTYNMPQCFTRVAWKFLMWESLK